MTFLLLPIVICLRDIRRPFNCGAAGGSSVLHYSNAIPEFVRIRMIEFSKSQISEQSLHQLLAKSQQHRG
jgi:hypothetical protein